MVSPLSKSYVECFSYTYDKASQNDQLHNTFPLQLSTPLSSSSSPSVGPASSISKKGAHSNKKNSSSSKVSKPAYNKDTKNYNKGSLISSSGTLDDLSVFRSTLDSIVEQELLSANSTSCYNSCALKGRKGIPVIFFATSNRLYRLTCAASSFHLSPGLTGKTNVTNSLNSSNKSLKYNVANRFNKDFLVTDLSPFLSSSTTTIEKSRISNNHPSNSTTRRDQSQIGKTQNGANVTDQHQGTSLSSLSSSNNQQNYLIPNQYSKWRLDQIIAIDAFSPSYRLPKKFVNRRATNHSSQSHNTSAAAGGLISSSSSTSSTSSKPTARSHILAILAIENSKNSGPIQMNNGGNTESRSDNNTWLGTNGTNNTAGSLNNGTIGGNTGTSGSTGTSGGSNQTASSSSSRSRGTHSKKSRTVLQIYGARSFSPNLSDVMQADRQILELHYVPLAIRHTVMNVQNRSQQVFIVHGGDDGLCHIYAQDTSNRGHFLELSRHYCLPELTPTFFQIALTQEEEKNQQRIMKERRRRRSYTINETSSYYQTSSLRRMAPSLGHSLVPTMLQPLLTALDIMFIEHFRLVVRGYSSGLLLLSITDTMAVENETENTGSAQSNQSSTNFSTGSSVDSSSIDHNLTEEEEAHDTNGDPSDVDNSIVRNGTLRSSKLQNLTTNAAYVPHYFSAYAERKVIRKMRHGRTSNARSKGISVNNDQEDVESQAEESPTTSSSSLHSPRCRVFSTIMPGPVSSIKLFSSTNQKPPPISARGHSRRSVGGALNDGTREPSYRWRGFLSQVDDLLLFGFPDDMANELHPDSLDERSSIVHKNDSTDDENKSWRYIKGLSTSAQSDPSPPTQETDTTSATRSGSSGPTDLKESNSGGVGINNSTTSDEEKRTASVATSPDITMSAVNNDEDFLHAAEEQAFQETAYDVNLLVTLCSSIGGTNSSSKYGDKKGADNLRQSKPVKIPSNGAVVFTNVVHNGFNRQALLSMPGNSGTNNPNPIPNASPSIKSSSAYYPPRPFNRPNSSTSLYGDTCLTGTVGDLTGSGQNDIILGTYSRHVLIYERQVDQQKSSSFFELTHVALLGSPIYGIYILDVDLDGINELIVVCQHGIHVFRPNGRILQDISQKVLRNLKRLYEIVQ
eukprot:g2980.t1